MTTSRGTGTRQVVVGVTTVAAGLACLVVGLAALVRPAVAPHATAALPTSQDSGRGHPGARGGRGRTSTTSHPFDRAAHSTTAPASIWVIVNKTHRLPPSYRPRLTLVRGYQVAVPAAHPLEHLLEAAAGSGVHFKIASAFRSYDYQEDVHAGLVATEGAREADRLSARAGHSEHQTGLAVDLVTPASPGCDFEACFASTPGGRWLARDAWRFGFIVRYRRSNEAITGYAPEPWHIRFVGRGLSRELHRTRISTLEEFFGGASGSRPTA